MSPEAIVAAVGGLVAIAGFGIYIARKLPKRVKLVQYTAKWRALQKQCANKDAWATVLIQADELLDDVLKKRRKEGKTMGERLVSAQDMFSNNDDLWKAHKLASHLKHDAQHDYKLKEVEVKESLMAFRQALRDLGAL